MRKLLLFAEISVVIAAGLCPWLIRTPVDAALPGLFVLWAIYINMVRADLPDVRDDDQ